MRPPTVALVQQKGGDASRVDPSQFGCCNPRKLQNYRQMCQEATETEGGHSDRLLYIVLCVCVCVFEFGSVRPFFPWFLGCSLISHKSTAMDATAPSTDSPVSGVPITVVVCSPCISQKSCVTEEHTDSIFIVISVVAFCLVMLVTYKVTRKVNYTCA
jgi:hypothetical protein